MQWLELSIRVPFEYVETISYLFDRHGFGIGLEKIDDAHILMKTYIPSRSTRRLAGIEIGINLIRTIQPLDELVKKQVVKEDWETAWKAHFHLQKVGKRTVIKPSWIQYDSLPGEIVLELDPGMAFGTGYHPTTRMCLEALEELVFPCSRVLDFGTGSGILAIAAAKFGSEVVMAIDKDTVATKTARLNIKANKVARNIVVRRGALPYDSNDGPSFDIVVTNISAKVVMEQAPNLFNVVRPYGIAIVSGFVKDQGKSVRKAMENAGFRTSRIRVCEELILLQCVRI